MRDTDKFKELIIEHSEKLKETFLDIFVGDENHFDVDKDSQKEKFQALNTNINRLNSQLSAYDMHVNVWGIMLQDPKNNNELTYRPQFELVSKDITIAFDKGRFFETFSIRNNQEDLIVLSPRYDMKAELSNDQLVRIKALMLLVNKEMQNAVRLDSDVSMDANMTHHIQKMREMTDLSFDDTALSLRQQTKSVGLRAH